MNKNAKKKMTTSKTKSMKADIAAVANGERAHATTARCSNCKRRTRLVLSVAPEMDDADSDGDFSASGTARCTLNCAHCGAELYENVLSFDGFVDADEDCGDDEHSWMVSDTTVADVTASPSLRIPPDAYGVRGEFVVECVCCGAPVATAASASIEGR